MEGGQEGRGQSPQTVKKYLAFILNPVGSQWRVWIEVVSETSLYMKTDDFISYVPEG